MKFTIEGRLPSLNEYILASRSNKYYGASMKKKQELYISAFILKAMHDGELEEITDYPISLHIDWFEQNNRRDIDNITFGTKFIQDALVRNGVIEDDSRKYINELTHRVMTDKEHPRIEVTIERGKYE